MISRRIKRVFRLFLVVVAGAAVGIGGYSLAQERVQKRAEAEPGQIVIAFVGDLTMQVSARGQVLPQRQANLALGITGRVEHVFVQVGDQVQAGDVLVQLETSRLERAVHSAEQNLVVQEARLAELRKGPSAEDIAIAQAAVDSAQAQLDQLQAGAREEEIAAAEANLRAAQAVLWSAAEQRDQVSAGPTETEIAAAEVQVADALAQQKVALDLHDWTMECDITIDPKTGKEEKHCPRLGTWEENARYQLFVADEALEAAQTYLNHLLAGPDQEQLDAANANVSAAAGQRDAAQAQLDLLQAGSSIYQITAAKAGVTQAKAALAALMAGASDEQSAILEAQVEQARIALDEARDNLTSATLVSPFDGVITAVYVSVGEFASGPAVEVADFQSLELVLNVDEVDIGAIKAGQPATMTLEAWPNQDLGGEVISIAPKSSPGEIVTYKVHLSLDAGRESGLPIRPGMSGTAELVTSHKENALLVPNITIIADRETGMFYVNLWENGSVVRREVETGLKDGRYTEILSGLETGDELLIEGEKALDLLDFSQGPPREIRELRQ